MCAAAWQPGPHLRKADGLSARNRLHQLPGALYVAVGHLDGRAPVHKRGALLSCLQLGRSGYQPNLYSRGATRERLGTVEEA